MSSLVHNLKTPYFAVVFSSIMNESAAGYAEMSEKMNELARKQAGFLGIESAREDIGVTVSYWSDLESIKRWKTNAEHLVAQKYGQEKWYSDYVVRIAKVERSYSLK